MVSLVAAMELLGDRQPLGWQTLALLALGLGCMLFALRHFRRTRWPMVRLDALKIPTFRVTMYGGSCSAPPLAPCRFCCRCFSVSDLVWTLPLGAAGAGRVRRQLNHQAPHNAADPLAGLSPPAAD